MRPGPDPSVAAGDAASDAELITLVRGGDRSAYGTLYARHSTAATTLARHFAPSTSDADDLVSEAFARVLDALLAGRGPDTAFRAYLFTTVRHTAFDRTRKDSKLQLTDDLTPHEPAEIPDDPVILKLENSLVARAFRSLPERWQAVLWHTQVEEEAPEKVGVLLGITANAVTSLAFRAREGLREAYLQAHLADTAAERCRATVNRLGSWARGGLSKREQAQVDAHLDACDECRALAAELTEINTSLRGLLAPLLLGSAATAYLAHSGTAVATGGGAVPASGTGGGASGATGHAAAAWFSQPWALAVGAAAAVAAIVAAVIIIPGGSTARHDAANPGAVAPVVTSSTMTPLPGDSLSAAGGPAAAAPSTTTPSTWQATATHSTAPGSTPPVSAAPNTAAALTPSGTGARASTGSVAVTPQASDQDTAPAPPTAGQHATATSTTTSTTASSADTSTTSSSAAPATLSAPSFLPGTVTAILGGLTTVAFTITNSGGVDSAPQQARVSMPTGVTISGATITSTGMGTAFRGGQPALAPRPTASSLAPRTASCTAGTCEYLVPARSTVTITLALAVSRTADSGDIVVSTPGGGRASVPIAVTAAVLAVRAGTAETRWVAGTIVRVSLRAVLADGVRSIGPVTLPATPPGLSIAPTDEKCAFTASVLTCTATEITDGTAYLGSVILSIGPDASGPMVVMATTAGGYRVAIQGAGGNTIVIARPSDPSAPSTTAPEPPADGSDGGDTAAGNPNG